MRAVWSLLSSSPRRQHDCGSTIVSALAFTVGLELIGSLIGNRVSQVNGIKFWAYNAGHVLGAAMFMIEIDGVRVLYTGDFSRWDDRHLTGAETPPISPDILLCESTFGAQEHPSAAIREKRLIEAITQTIKANGRVLLPVFALGRAQEILLILDEWWDQHPELQVTRPQLAFAHSLRLRTSGHALAVAVLACRLSGSMMPRSMILLSCGFVQSVPIYYGSKIASKSMAVYKKYITQMNERIQAQMDGRNPFDFKHVEMVRCICVKLLQPLLGLCAYWYVSQ